MMLFGVTNLFLWATFCVLCLFLLLKHHRRKNSKIYQCTSKIRGPLSYPIIGSAYVFFGGTDKILETIAYYIDKYHPMVKFWMGSKCYVWLGRPEDVQVVLNKSLKKEDGYKYLIPVFGNGLFTRSVEEWRPHRKVVLSTFTQSILNTFIESFNEYTKIMTEKLKPYSGKDDYIDMFPPMTHLTLDIMCSTVMGIEMNAMKEESPFILWMTRVAELAIVRMFNVHLWIDWIWNMLKISKESVDLDGKIQNYVDTVIKNKRYGTKRDPHKKKIFLDYLLELTDEAGTWSDDELTNETRSVIMAGSDATALTLSYCFILLGMFPEEQEKVYKELLSVFGESDRFVTIDDLPRLDYLERFIKETLRIFPVSSSIARELVEDITLGEYTLPKGTSIGIPVLHLHRSPRYWKNPLKFDPDRFLPEEVAKRHPCCYLPFSYGPRNCIGPKYAFMLMKVILANILRCYRVTSTSYKCITDLRLKMDIATKVDEGYNIRIELREKITQSAQSTA